jgi:hypothetical protein
MNSADKTRELLNGTREIAEFCVPNVGKMTLHVDLIAAKSTIAKVYAFEKNYGVRIVLAHDVSWMGPQADEVLLSLLDNHMVKVRDRILQGGIP